MKNQDNKKFIVISNTSKMITLMFTIITFIFTLMKLRSAIFFRDGYFLLSFLSACLYHRWKLSCPEVSYIKF